MDSREIRTYALLPQIGCGLVFAAMLAMCVMPLVMLDVMQSALIKLHLSAPMALLATVGIIVGGLVNLPIRRWQRDDIQLFSRAVVPGMMSWVPGIERGSFQTILAVNVGGCLIPLAIAIYELPFVFDANSQARVALAAAVVVNVLICYWVSRPVPGVGIIMPGFVAPLAAVGVTWLLLGWGNDYAAVRAPVAFIAGVSGPIIGADLLRLKDLTRVSVGVCSIGGAGTFDGIVLSGILAAFFA